MFTRINFYLLTCKLLLSRIELLLSRHSLLHESTRPLLAHLWLLWLAAPWWPVTKALLWVEGGSSA